MSSIYETILSSNIGTLRRKLEMKEKSCMDEKHYFHYMSSTKLNSLEKKERAKEQFTWQCLSLHSAACLYRVSLHFAVM